MWVLFFLITAAVSHADMNLGIDMTKPGPSPSPTPSTQPSARPKARHKRENSLPVGIGGAANNQGYTSGVGKVRIGF